MSDNGLENVLILQGGGSLGAFGCGVYKALAKNNINLDVIAGTSIGGVNAAIIAGSRKEERVDQLLEDFWLELSEGFIDIDKLSPFFAWNRYMKTFQIPSMLGNYSFNLPFFAAIGTGIKETYLANGIQMETKLKQIKSFYSSIIFGNSKMFIPRWSPEYALTDPEYFAPQKWTFLYDHFPLAKTLERYIDYDKLRPGGRSKARLILTAVNVLNARPLTFDSHKEQITAKHVLATSAYPSYNFPWVEVEDGVFAWDGSLLSNTPLREVITATPVRDKRIFIVENYPKKIDSLPNNLPEVYHRARDIMFSDKTEHNVQMSKVISRYLDYIEELYKTIENNIDKLQIEEKQLKRIRQKYKVYKQEHGAEIKEIYYVKRDEPNPHITENADFSPETIKSAIKEGEEKTNEIIKNKKFEK
ncbi:patatin-like phospholipase family protein [Candidatus Nitrosocosmicus franklandus]|uniref:Patatin-like phospholipase n=1 Tax=Candidatus Nitrosocosmicus franklandianus TaxID=1798806 RepID=A0A484IAT2_9ARCH|nr:patatin-like phospholipase family protein [Candidatus Nitrosocosmicus franklandus]VFJ14862.1 Patatin-like phospholipase [Candidatus Nitrosocosmicus franklandus]